MLFIIMMWMTGLAVAGGGIAMIVYAFTHSRNRYATVYRRPKESPKPLTPKAQASAGYPDGDSRQNPA
jgi:hypothetical protein